MVDARFDQLRANLSLDWMPHLSDLMRAEQDELAKPDTSMALVVDVRVGTAKVEVGQAAFDVKVPAECRGVHVGDLAVIRFGDAGAVMVSYHSKADVLPVNEPSTATIDKPSGYTSSAPSVPSTASSAPSVYFFVHDDAGSSPSSLSEAAKRLSVNENRDSLRDARDELDDLRDYVDGTIKVKLNSLIGDVDTVGDRVDDMRGRLDSLEDAVGDAVDAVTELRGIVTQLVNVVADSGSGFKSVTVATDRYTALMVSRSNGDGTFLIGNLGMTDGKETQAVTLGDTYDHLQAGDVVIMDTAGSWYIVAEYLD